MKFKIAALLLLICSFSISCAPKQKLPKKIDIEIDADVDPNSIAIVTLKLEGETMPGTPRVVSADNSAGAFYDRIGAPEYVVQVTDKEWVTVLTLGKSYVIGWLVEDKKMFGYCSEPFVAAKDLVVPFSPGMPASLEYDLTNPREDINIFPTAFLLKRKALRDGKLVLVPFGIIEQIEEPKIIKIGGLAQGTYQLFVQDLKGDTFLDSRTIFLFDRRYIEIESGQVTRVKPQYPILDTTVEQGDVTIRGLMHNTEGKRFSDTQIKLIPFNDDGPRFDLYYPDAVTDSNGFFEFKGVRPNTSVLVKYFDASVRLDNYLLTKNADLWVDFIIDATGLKLYKDYSVPEFFIDWKNGGTTSIYDKELYGKTIVAVVWASWCQSGQKALSDLNSLALEYKDSNDVVFAAINIDDDRAAWEDAANKSTLTALRQGWYNRNGKHVAFNRAIPYSMIIDKKGMLRADGNSLDIRVELEKVLKASE